AMPGARGVLRAEEPAEGIGGSIRRSFGTEGQPGQFRGRVDRTEVVHGADQLSVPVEAKSYSVGAHGKVVPHIEGPINWRRCENPVRPGFDLRVQDRDAVFQGD